MQFILCQKLFSFLRYLHFCLDFYVMQKNSLIKKLTVISKFMTSQTGQQIITTHTYIYIYIIYILYIYYIYYIDMRVCVLMPTN